MIKQIKLKIPKHLNAFSFLEIGFCLLIIGIIGSIAFPLMTKVSASAFKVDVLEKHKKIEQSLASYVLRHQRLPFASKPQLKGKEQRYQSIGIVPYKTLGLDEKLVKDKSGNWFTYAVTPSLAEVQGASSSSLFGESDFCTVTPSENDIGIQNYSLPVDDMVAFVVVAHNLGNGSFSNNFESTFKLKDSSLKSICEQKNAQMDGSFCIEPCGDTIFWISRNNFTAHHLENLCFKKKSQEGGLSSDFIS
ncbi:MAG: hypothetical protein HEEMFOPI_00808 [Holosporales bacterium]